MVGIRLQKDTKRKSVCTTTSEYIWLPYNYIWRFWFRYFFVFKFLFALFWFQFVFFLLINDDVLLLLNIDFLSTAKYLVHISSVLWLLLTRRKSRFFLIYGSRMGGPLRLFSYFFPLQESSFWFVPNEDEFPLSKFDSSFS